MRRRIGPFGRALVLAVCAPAAAAVLFVVHLELWVSAAERHGLQTTDWGFAIIFAFVQLVFAAVAGLVASLTWSRREHRMKRLVGCAVVAAVDLVAVSIGLPMGPHYLESDLPNIAAMLLTVGAVGWLFSVARRRTTTLG